MVFLYYFASVSLPHALTNSCALDLADSKTPHSACQHSMPGRQAWLLSTFHPDVLTRQIRTFYQSVQDQGEPARVALLL